MRELEAPWSRDFDDPAREWRRLISEVFGTLLLVMVGVGAGGAVVDADSGGQIGRDIIHVTQARCHPPAKKYLARKISENKSKREARRCHKRQLANVIIRHMWNDAERYAQTTTTDRMAAT